MDVFPRCIDMSRRLVCPGRLKSCWRRFFPSKGRDTGSRGQDRGSRGRDPGSRGRDRGSRGRDPESRGRDWRSRGLDPTSIEWDPASRGLDPASRERDPGSRGRDPGSRGLDPGSSGLDPGSGGRVWRSRRRDRGSRTRSSHATSCAPSPTASRGASAATRRLCGGVAPSTRETRTPRRPSSTRCQARRRSTPLGKRSPPCSATWAARAGKGGSPCCTCAVPGGRGRLRGRPPREHRRHDRLLRRPAHAGTPREEARARGRSEEAQALTPRCIK